jgi:hypothetical protein
MSNGQTSWEEPAELAAESLRASVVPLNRPKPTSSSSDIVSSWREMVAASGKKYYYNAVTKVTMWEVPPEYAEYLERIKDPAAMDKDVLEAKFMAMLKEKVRRRQNFNFYRKSPPNLAGRRPCEKSLITHITNWCQR